MAKLWTLKGKKILIVDDFPAMRSMMRTMLAAFGADNIAEARTGEEALELLEEESKEIILCDYNLGEGKDGQQVLEEAKHRELIPYSTVFILVTAENTSDMVMGAMEHQPDDYLIKPFTKTVLQMRLRKLQEKKAGFLGISNAIESKDYQRALGLCNNLVKQDPKTAFEIFRIKGEIYQKLSDFAAAEDIYEKVLTSREINWAKYGLGKVLFYQDQLDEAKEVLEDLVANNPKFVIAYDWLAKVETALGNKKKAQTILSQAVEISPKGILRQRALGDISLENEDFDRAEKAYKTVVKKGKNSFYRNPDDFGGLAKVYAKKNNSKSALQVLSQMNSEYSDAEGQDKLQTSLIEGIVHKGLGNEEQSIAALDKAMNIFTEQPGMLSSDSAMELAEACFSFGKTEQGDELIKHVVRNNHEDKAVLDKAKQLYTDLGMESEGSDLIAGAQKEVVGINNEGVGLAKEGKLKESIRLLTKAARAMPESLIINLNTAQSIIMLMQSNGVSDRYLEQARRHLDRARLADPGSERFKQLLDHYHQLSRKSA